MGARASVGNKSEVNVSSAKSSVRYVPVLPAKRGELTALRDSAPAVRSAIRPLIEVPPLKWDWEEGTEAETLDEQIASLSGILPKSLLGLSFFLDLPNLPDVAQLQSGAHAAGRLITLCRAVGVPVIPVTGPDRNTAYRDAVKASIDAHGVMLRIRGTDLGGIVAGSLSHQLNHLGVTAEHVDLLIDLGRIEHDAPVVTLGVLTLLRSPQVTELPWRSITVASGAFPESMSAFSGVGAWMAPRLDRKVWTDVCSQLRADERIPWFGDYAVQVPDPESVDPRVMRMSANIRYTSTNDWLVLKGRTVSGKNAQASYDEFRALCSQLVVNPLYCGDAFSPGDRYIRECADGVESPGNAETWRRNGTSHHLAYVVHELANPAA